MASRRVDDTTAGEVKSPCVGVCSIDPGSGFCRGCLRTVAEIAAWRDASTTERRRVLAQIDARVAAGFSPASPPAAAG